VATKYLARKDSRVAAIIGTGGQARTQLEAVAWSNWNASVRHSAHKIFAFCRIATISARDSSFDAATASSCVLACRRANNRSNDENPCAPGISCHPEAAQFSVAPCNRLQSCQQIAGGHLVEWTRNRSLRDIVYCFWNKPRENPPRPCSEKKPPPGSQTPRG